MNKIILFGIYLTWLIAINLYGRGRAIRCELFFHRKGAQGRRKKNITNNGVKVIYSQFAK